jgi:hypothetical protein
MDLAASAAPMDPAASAAPMDPAASAAPKRCCQMCVYVNFGSKVRAASERCC